MPGNAATQIKHLARLKSEWNPSRGIPLLSVLEETRSKNATRPQDKINGILALLDAKDQVSLAPKSGQTDTELNEWVTKVLIERTGLDFMLNEYWPQSLDSSLPLTRDFVLRGHKKAHNELSILPQSNHVGQIPGG